MHHIGASPLLASFRGGCARRRHRRARRNPRLGTGARLCPDDILALAQICRFRAGLRPAAARQDHRASAKKALGIDLDIETINGDGVQARITSAIQSNTGPDIMMAVNNWAQLYADSVVDVSDVAEEIGKAQGGYYETANAVANDGKKWIAVPYTILGVLIANRTSWFKEVGYGPDKFPQTWEEYRAVGQEAESQGASLWPDAGPRLSATARRSGTPIFGRGAARKSRPTARPSC